MYYMVIRAVTSTGDSTYFVVKARRPYKRVPRWTLSIKRNPETPRRVVKYLSDIIPRVPSQAWFGLRDYVGRWLNEGEFREFMARLIEASYKDREKVEERIAALEEFIKAEMPKEYPKKPRPEYPIVLTKRFALCYKLRMGSREVIYSNYYTIYEFPETYHVFRNLSEDDYYVIIPKDARKISLRKLLRSPDGESARTVMREVYEKVAEALTEGWVEKREAERLRAFLEVLKAVISLERLLI
jgi:hypothetical protein